MPSSDEVWARGVPPRSGLVVVLATQPELAQLEDAVLDSGFRLAPVVVHDFAAALQAVECADVAILDVRTAQPYHLVLFGYALGRGKTLLGYVGLEPVDWLIDDAAYLVNDRPHLIGALRALRGERVAPDRSQVSEGSA